MLLDFYKCISNALIDWQIMLTYNLKIESFTLHVVTLQQTVGKVLKIMAAMVALSF